MPNSVDEKRRRTVYTATDAAAKILLDLGCHLVGGEITHEPIYVKLQLLGPRDQIPISQVMLVLIQHVVHFPEPVLHGGCFRRTSGGEGMGMNLGQGKIAKYEPQISIHLFLNALDNGKRLAAVGALVIAVLNECHLCVIRSLYVVAGIHRHD